MPWRTSSPMPGPRFTSVTSLPRKSSGGMASCSAEAAPYSRNLPSRSKVKKRSGRAAMKARFLAWLASSSSSLRRSSTVASAMRRLRPATMPSMKRKRTRTATAATTTILRSEVRRSSVPNHLRFDRRVGRAGDRVEHRLHGAQEPLVSLRYGAVEFAARDRDRRAELALDAELVEEVEGRRLVDAEDFHLAPARGLDDVLVILVVGEIGHAVGLEGANQGIARLDGDPEALEVRKGGQAADGLVEKNAGIDLGVGWAEIIKSLPLGRLEDRVDHVGVASLHAALRLVPAEADERDLPAGPALPLPPLVDHDALEPALGVAEGVGRIIVVRNHSQRRLRGGRKNPRREGEG